jgi:hypothetical protein
VFGSVLVGLLHQDLPADARTVNATRLPIFATLLPVVIKGTLEMMNSGVALEGIASRVVEPRRPPVAHLIVDLDVAAVAGEPPKIARVSPSMSGPPEPPWR